jgi:hypothetical protein
VHKNGINSCLIQIGACLSVSHQWFFHGNRSDNSRLFTIGRQTSSDDVWMMVYEYSCREPCALCEIYRIQSVYWFFILPAQFFWSIPYCSC